MIFFILISSSFAIPAFPGAEGVGANSVGGRGGTVYIVSNLDDSGSGSLREAVEAVGSRMIVFNVSDWINLSSTLTLNNDNCTIAGQTSPGGVGIVGEKLSIRASNIIIQHMRFASGGQLYEGDSLSIRGEAYDGCTNDCGEPENADIIIDHCSIRYACDECGETGYNPDRITISWSIIGPGLYGCHSEGSHNYGFLIWGKYSPNTIISMHHNYFPHNYNRNPEINGAMQGGYRHYPMLDGWNNVEFEAYGSYGAFSNGLYNKVNWRQNRCKKGVDNNPSPQGREWTIYPSDLLSTTPEPILYVNGNRGCYEGVYTTEWESVEYRFTGAPPSSEWQSLIPFAFLGVQPNITTMTPDYANTVLESVGATKPVRDSVDALYIADYNDSTSRWLDGNEIQYPNAIYWPPFQNIAPPVDTDNDGMSDVFEIAQGFNITIDDSALDYDSNGYTNIEEYIYYLVENKTINETPVIPLGNPYDANTNNLIDTSELIPIINAWRNNELSMMEAFNLLNKWKRRQRV